MEQPLAMPELALVLPLPPSINHQYATVNGRRVLSRAGRDYKALWPSSGELAGTIR
jgi:crossover junction endodeoxyribonuclease RusA